jgi:spore germination cell wall hydrolase CwlJ-like protein
VPHWQEDRREGKIGVQLVTQVVLNRANRSNKTVCEVVYQPYQFSWTSQAKKKKPKHKTYLEVREHVTAIFLGLERVPSQFKAATHFHTKDVKPMWRRQFAKVGVWNNHVFYEGDHRG